MTSQNGSQGYVSQTNKLRSAVPYNCFWKIVKSQLLNSKLVSRNFQKQYLSTTDNSESQFGLQELTVICDVIEWSPKLLFLWVQDIFARGYDIALWPPIKKWIIWTFIFFWSAKAKYYPHKATEEQVKDKFILNGHFRGEKWLLLFFIFRKGKIWQNLSSLTTNRFASAMCEKWTQRSFFLIW